MSTNPLPGEYRIMKLSIQFKLKEMLYIFFYLWYLVEWLVKLFRYGRNAYENISFEREAYTYQYDYSYLEKRKKYHWIKRL